MNVLIVAKTRQGSGACIGGITFDGRSVRLIAADAATNEHAGREYDVGDVWAVDAHPATDVIPPHVENIVVHRKRRMGPMTNPAPFIERHMPPRVGGPDALYEGLTQATPTGALYIAQASGVPPYSTTFWRPDQPLQLVHDGKRLRYRYPTPDGGRTLVFVGFQEPLDVMPAGTLVRVSLAHWWRPQTDETGELRCYVQLSGWFLSRSERDRPPHAAPAGAATEDVAAEAASSPNRRGHTSGSPNPEASGQGDPRPAQTGCEPLPPGPSPTARPLAGAGEMAEARRLLKTVFGHDAFWPPQAEIIANVLRRRDTLAVMPTGGGKSLCYQLPALLFDGLTVVVSPLIALMQDQVDQLRESGVPAAFLNSTLDYPNYVATMRDVRQGVVKLLYTSPETLLRPETLVMLDQCQVDCLTIDEAHCISSWGHDFRPEYRQLLPVRRRYPATVCLALTATATPRVQQDITATLGFDQANVFVASFNRKNLYLAVRPRIDGLGQTLAFLAAHRGESGIIYCSTREGVDRLAAQLAERGWPARPYHAGLDDETRLHHQRLFVRDEAPIMVATIAFGMGIDKSNVRFVLHYNLPKNIENYYQEIGRAGRDGLRADCLLLFSQGDVGTIYHFIEQGAAAERPGRSARLQALVRYAQSRECRRAPLLGYFGETVADAACSMCDNCLAAGRSEAGAEADAAAQADVTEAAQKFLRCVMETGQMFGAGHIVDVLRGSRSQKVLRQRHDRLSTYDAGQEYPAKQWRHLAQEFITQGLVTQDMQYGSLHLTSKGHQVLKGEKVYAMLAELQAGVSGPAAERPYDAVLFEQLRGLRRQLADEANLPPFIIFSDRSLAEMTTFFPQTPERFTDIDGVGQRKLERYGERFLAVIRAYCQEQGIQEIAKGSAASARATTRTSGKRRFEEVGELFAAGHSVEDLEALYGVKTATIVSHLYRYLQAGGPVDAGRVLGASGLDPETQERVLAVFAEHGPERLNPIFEALGGTVSYDELHVLRVYYVAGSRD